MLKLIAKLSIKEGQVEAFTSLATELAKETRKEDGCISYRLFQDVADDNTLVFFEEFENQEAHDRHVKSKHFTEINAKMMLLQDKNAVVNFYRLVL